VDVRTSVGAVDRPIQVLIADDEDTFRTVLARELNEMGFEVRGVSGGKQALAALNEEEFDVVLLDVKMPDMDGLTVQKAVKEAHPLVEVIMMTGYGTIDSAIAAIRSGAYDYLTKPCKLEELEALLIKAAERRRLEHRNIMLRQELSRQARADEFVGNSPRLRTVLSLIAKVARSDSTVLIQGESGVGKELAARAIHNQSGRKDNPFIVVDCTSLQEELLQSELFGHEKGAFTGAASLKHGLFEVADTGTLFFDEIGEMTLGLQSKLLRFMETGTFRRVGGLKDIHVDTRIIAATNRNLKDAASAGQFREDLYYRLNVFSFTIPPLRERVEDITVLAKHFVDRTVVQGRRRWSIAPEAIEHLEAYDWPGNVRELRNVLERALILVEGDRIEVEDLPANLQSRRPFMGENLSQGTPTLEQAEKLYIARLLKENGGNRAKVARILDISERNLYRKIKHYGL
jgi:two-component system response regulator AtoC